LRIELKRRGFMRYVTCLLKAMPSHPNRRGENIMPVIINVLVC
jgi:hypothetical protein